MCDEHNRTDNNLTYTSIQFRNYKRMSFNNVDCLIEWIWQILLTIQTIFFNSLMELSN